MDIGTKIKEIRTNLNLTQDEFAKLINRSTSAIKKYEANMNITVDLLQDISKKLDVSMLSLFADSKDLFSLFLEINNFDNLSPSQIDTLRVEFNVLIDFLVKRYN